MLILSAVDVQHGDPDFDIAFALIGVAQFQYLLFRLLLCPVIEADTDGPGDRLERTAVLVVIAGCDVLLIQPSGVEEKRIGIFGLKLL